MTTSDPRPAAGLTYFVLAGGYGRRADPLTRFRAKPAFPLAGKPLIGRLVEQLRRSGLEAGFVNLHHRGEDIRRALANTPGVRFLEEEALGGNRVLRRALPGLAGPLLAVNGDTWLQVPVAAMAADLERSGADLVVLARRRAEGGYRGLNVAAGRCRGRLPPGVAGEWTFAGAVLLAPSAVEGMDELNLFDALEKSRMEAVVREYAGPWLELGSPRVYRDANFAFPPRRDPATANLLSPGARLEPGADARGCVLWEGAVVSAGACLRGCIVLDGVCAAGRHQERILTPDGGFPLE